MRSLIGLIIIGWNILLQTISRPFGLLFGGLVIGFRQGINDQLEIAKYLKYKAYQLEKLAKEKENDEQDSDKHKR